MVPLALLAVFAVVAAACTEEPAVEIDLNSTVADEPLPSASTTQAPTGGTGGTEGPEAADPNAEQNRITLQYAEQQCLDDPDLEQGYVQIIDQATNNKVGEVTVDCAELRAAQTIDDE